MKGTITYFNSSKNYGFITTYYGDEYFFFYPKTNESRKERKIRMGECVKFEIRESQLQEGRQEAIIHSFDGNVIWEDFVNDLRTRPFRAGYLKRIDGKWHVKIMDEKFMIPVKVSPFETDIETVYDQRHNQMVAVNLNVISKGEVSAILEDRKMLTSFNQANIIKKSNQLIEAKITGSNSDVFFATLFGNNLPVTILKKDLPENIEYQKNDLIDVRISSISESSIQVLPELFYVDKN